MFKNGENQEAATALFTVVIQSFYLERLTKNMKRVDCQGSLPTPFQGASQVKDIVPQCSR
jgi:hypothetical protein